MIEPSRAYDLFILTTWCTTKSRNANVGDVRRARRRFARLMAKQARWRKDYIAHLNQYGTLTGDHS